MKEPVVIRRENELWVVGKPAGWVVHPTNDGSMRDLVTWAEGLDEGAKGMAPIHRIDRETSGVVLMSPNGELRGEIGKWFVDGEVKKEYRALVYGTTAETGRVDKPLEDRRRGKKLEAVTEFRTLERFVSCSYLAVFPETGRKHQIRRHLQGINHAIVGEKRYKPKKFLRVPGFPGRLWLHAYRVELPDGRVFEAELAKELEEQLELMRGL